MERSLLSVMARRSVLVALLVGLVTAAPAGAQTGRLPDCADHSLPSLLLPNGYPFDVHRASALFRFHRQQAMPVVGESAVLRYLATQPRYEQLDSRYAESAQSGDLGYTWGTWSRSLPPARGARGAASTTAGQPAPAPGRGQARFETGFYTRVWVRERSGQWKVVLDVLN